MKVVVEIGSDIDAHKASEREFITRYKSTGVLKVVTDRGLQVIEINLHQSTNRKLFSFT